VKCLHAAAAARSLRIRRVIHPSIVFDIVSVCVLTGFDTALGGESNEYVLPPSSSPSAEYDYLRHRSVDGTIV